MPFLLAMTPPVPIGGRLFVAALGYGLALALSCRLRGRPPLTFCGLGLLGTLLLVVGLDRMGTADPRGVLAFLVGMAGAVLVIGKRSGQAVSAERDRGIAWLTVASVAAGLCIGLCLFGVWYWQASPVERVDAGWDAGMFVGFGLFAGTAAAVVVILLGLGVRSRGPG